MHYRHSFVASISFELKHYTGNCPLLCGRPASDPSSTVEVLENTTHAILHDMHTPKHQPYAIRDFDKRVKSGQRRANRCTLVNSELSRGRKHKQRLAMKMKHKC
jgi:hypothetical protein